MPRTGNYSLGKIYELVSDQTDDIYIASTCQRLLSKRLVGHTWSYTNWLNEGCCDCSTSFEIVKYLDCKIVNRKLKKINRSNLLFFPKNKMTD